MRFGPRTWNDVLAVLILVGAPAIVVFTKVPDIAVGTLLAGWTLVVQYFFRRAPDSGTP